MYTYYRNYLYGGCEYCAPWLLYVPSEMDGFLSPLGKILLPQAGYLLAFFGRKGESGSHREWTFLFEGP